MGQQANNQLIDFFYWYNYCFIPTSNDTKRHSLNSRVSRSSANSLASCITSWMCMSLQLQLSLRMTMWRFLHFATIRVIAVAGVSFVIVLVFDTISQGRTPSPLTSSLTVKVVQRYSLIPSLCHSWRWYHCHDSTDENFFPIEYTFPFIWKLINLMKINLITLCTSKLENNQIKLCTCIKGIFRNTVWKYMNNNYVVIVIII